MASSSPLDISHLNSTSGLLAVLDLNGKSIENMEDMDADQIIDVPDTPDQLVTRTTSARDCIEKDSILSVVGNSGSPKYLDEKCVVRPGDRGKLFNGNWYNRRLNFHSLKDPSNPDEFEHRTDSCFHPSGRSFASMNDHLFSRLAADKTSKHGANHSTGPKHIDKGKGLCTKFSSSVSCEEDSDCVDLTEQSKNEQIFQNGVPCGPLVNLLPKEVKGRSLETSGCSSKTANRNYELMEEKNDYTIKVPTSGVDRGNQNNILCKSQCEAEKCVPASPHRIPLHRVAGQKRLVKNGCISPHNIAKAKQLAERLGHDSKGVELNDARRTTANDASCVIDISGSVSEDRKVKGKGVITHSSTSKEYDGKTLCLPGRNPTPHKEEANKEEANRTGHGSRSASDSLEGLGGWRSTRNRSKKLHLPSSDGTGVHPGRNNSFYTILNGNKVDKRDNKFVINNRTSCDSPEVEDQIPFRHGTTRPLSQTISSSVSEPDQGNAQHHVGNANIKRQRKLKSAPSHPGECSTSVVHGSEVVFLDSPGESSNLRSSGDQIGHRRRIRDMIIEIEDSRPERRANASQDFGCTIDGNSDARARQVEADEILARELQEQLYHESPVFGGGEVDANLARALQQSEQAQQDSSSGSRRDFLLRNSLNSRLYRSQIQNQVRRGNQARVPASNRMAQLRRRFRSQSPATISRERIVPFPVQMDLDRRMDILEALETAASDLSSTIRRSNIAGVRRDFNENDYEMLLALDENNHQHGGASVGQINSLPQSTVQTDTFEEACVICLETPTTGDIVRHLPCLHKFHKDCIDPWLSRRTSCPVCKSSIS